MEELTASLKCLGRFIMVLYSSILRISKDSLQIIQGGVGGKKSQVVQNISHLYSGITLYSCQAVFLDAANLLRVLIIYWLVYWLQDYCLLNLITPPGSRQLSSVPKSKSMGLPSLPRTSTPVA